MSLWRRIQDAFGIPADTGATPAEALVTPAAAPSDTDTPFLKPANIGQRLYAGAADNRLTGDFLQGITSGRQELKGDLQKLRARSRQLCRDNPVARRFLALCAENVIGHKGIRLQAKAENARGELSTDLNGRIEEAWCDWGRPATCTVTGYSSWPHFQAQILQTVARDGEAFVRRVRGYPNRYGYALQLLDADQCDEGFDRKAGPGVNQIISGVEVDGWGKPVAYWLWSDHPNDAYGVLRLRQRVRVPADEVLHLFVPKRAGQVRGEPWLTPVIIWLQMLYGYAEAELVAARTAAAKMGFIVQGEEALGTDPEQDYPTTMQAEAGVIDRLAKGETFQAWDPTHPSGNFGPFLNTVLHLVAQGLNVSHANLTGDLSQVNYSSIRAGMLAERDQWRLLQAWFAEHCCQPVFEGWLPMAMLSPWLTLPGGDASRYFTAATWQPRGWAWVDPQKDVQAAVEARKHGMTTLRRILAEQGDDLEELLMERAEEDALLAEYGITLGDPPAQAPASDSPGEAEDTAADDGEDAAEAPAMEKALETMTGLAREVAGAVKWAAGRELPQPTVTVEAPVVNIAPAEITVPVTVEAKPGTRTIRHVRNAKGEVVSSEVVDG